MVSLIVFYILYVILGLAFCILRVKDYKAKSDMQTRLNKFLLCLQIFVYIALLILSGYSVYMRLR